MAAADMTWCPRCQQLFADTDNTGVCPAGHETRDIDDDEVEQLEHLRGVTW